MRFRPASPGVSGNRWHYCVAAYRQHLSRQSSTISLHHGGWYMVWSVRRLFPKAVLPSSRLDPALLAGFRRRSRGTARTAGLLFFTSIRSGDLLNSALFKPCWRSANGCDEEIWSSSIKWRTPLCMSSRTRSDLTTSGFSVAHYVGRLDYGVLAIAIDLFLRVTHAAMQV